MILLTADHTDDAIIVTLNEKRTLGAGYYLFVFTHILTKNVVNKIFGFLDDESAYPDRFNQFEIDTSTVFLDQPPGQWIYQVYEQASSVNTNTTGLNEVERGIMQLDPAEAFEFENYNPSTSFKAYNG